MKSANYNLDLSFSQVLELIRQMPKSEKMRLSKELEKDILNTKLTELLKAFKTDEIDPETITNEVEKVRAAIYEKSKARQRHH